MEETKEFYNAASCGDIETLKKYLKRDLNYLNLLGGSRYFLSVLHLAANADHAACCKFLLKCGADPHLQDGSRGYRVLHWASDNCCKILLKAGANPNLPGNGGAVPLHAITRNKMLVLLKGGADPHFKDSFGNTPLYWAKLLERNDCVELLQNFIKMRANCPTIVWSLSTNSGGPQINRWFLKITSFQKRL